MIMAKALFGHLGAPSAEHAHETAVLRRRIGDLENEVLRLKAENDGLLARLAETSHDGDFAELLESASR
jgi:hypothetical protein